MVVNVAINGFGRIGRLVAREQALKGYKSFKIVAVNDPGTGGIKAFAHRLQFDSTYRGFPTEVKVEGNDVLNIGGLGKVKFLAEFTPDWRKESAQIIMEATGLFVDANTLKKSPQWHIDQGAERVIVSAPTKGADNTFVFGVNHETFDPATNFIMSGASCTTNCLAPVAMVLDKSFGIEDGIMTTVHAPTMKQPPIDGQGSDRASERATQVNIIPSSTGAAKAVGLVLPQLNGKLTGKAFRVPTIGSVVDLFVNLKSDVTADGIRAAMKAASEGQLKGVLGYADVPITSLDVLHQNFVGFSSVFDGNEGTLVGINRHFNMLSWYDNEAGFTANYVRLLNYIAEQVGG